MEVTMIPAGKKMFWGLFMAIIVLAPLLSYASSGIRVTSTAFKNGGRIGEKYVFSGFGCKGRNVSPEIRWGTLPRGTKSVALTVYDPDAPTGSGWWHWVVYNIPPSVHELPEGVGTKEGRRLPAGAVQAVTDFGAPGYGGPCPPKGDRPHHYIITVYALKTPKLGVSPGASPAQVGYFLHFKTIGKGRLVGRYGR
ncbi:MAG: YbhB/YbcL family Raf kinase inhibitor-like protein [Nitrospiraceae bacterium]|nr:YbhB/YbcL family Raf kinase inhibitor-like protein [Nitrospiraceae bacterium]